MDLVFVIGSCFGYFFIMIIFMLFAIASAKSKGAWIVYAIGALLQFMALSGKQKTAADTDTNQLWDIYAGILLVTAILILIRYFKAISSDNSNKNQ